MRLCSIASGSSGNCIYVGSDNTHLLVDVGISGKRVEQGLNSLELTGKDIDGILITFGSYQRSGRDRKETSDTGLCDRRNCGSFISHESWKNAGRDFS